MPILIFSNNAASVIGGPFTSGETTLVVEIGKGALFPNPDPDEYFKLTLEDRRESPVKREIVHCTARSGDTLTIVRGQEGTSAQAFNAGFVASHRTTAGTMSAISAAVANFANFWLGSHATPPIVSNDGGPIPTGALYFNTVTLITYAWDGVAWRAQLVPMVGATTRLFYNATGGQVDFGNALDINGLTLTLSVAFSEPVVVFQNGLALTSADYTVNWAANKITLAAPAALNDKVQLWQLTPPAALAPSASDIDPLRDIDLDPGSGTPGYIDGTRATFKVRDVANNPIFPNDAFALILYLDGVPQQPGVNFTVATDEMTFDENLPAGTKFWGVYFA